MYYTFSNYFHPSSKQHLLRIYPTRLIMPTLQSNGGAALGIRSNDSFDDEDIWLLVCTSVFWVPVALVLLVVICCLLMDLGLLCWHICKKLAR